MKRYKLIQQLNWANIETASESMTSLQIKTMGAVLTKKGVGTVIFGGIRDGRQQFRCINCNACWVRMMCCYLD